MEMKMQHSLSFWESFRDSVCDSVLIKSISGGRMFSRDGLKELFNTKDAGATDADATTFSATICVAAGIATVAVVGIGLKSLVKMAHWQNKLRDAETNSRAPGPRPLPLLGNVIELRKDYYKSLYDYVEKPASVFWVLSTPFVVVNYEEGLRRVLGGAGGMYTKPKYFGYRSKAVKAAVQVEKEKVAEESIEYLNDGDTSRVALENMIRGSLNTIKISMEDLLQSLANASLEESKDAYLESADSFVRRAIVALNLEVLFGLNKSSTTPEDPARISDMIGFAGGEFARRMVNPLKVFVDFWGNLKYVRDVGGLIQLGRRLCKLLDESARYIASTSSMPKHTPGSAAGLSWVHAWVGKVGRIGKLGKVVGLLMASTQTVPLTAVWMLHLVGNDAQIRKRLLEELEQLGIKSADDVTYDNLAKMQLADAVIKETLRLYPPFPLIQREAQEDDILGGITIPQGAIVYVVPWLVHRNPTYWKDADSFQPDRFMHNSTSHGDAPSDWAYLPFGRGARMCAGSKLAMTELKILLTLGILSYHWESRLDAQAKHGRFPELGMVPKGINLIVRRVDRVKLGSVVTNSHGTSPVVV